jgi:hypothetical protein
VTNSKEVAVTDMRSKEINPSNLVVLVCLPVLTLRATFSPKLILSNLKCSFLNLHGLDSQEHLTPKLGMLIAQATEHRPRYVWHALGK